MIVWITHVKVGHRQTPINRKALLVRAFLFMVFGVGLLERSDNTPRSFRRMRFLYIVSGGYTLCPSPCVRLVVASKFNFEAWRQQWEHVIQKHLSSRRYSRYILVVHLNPDQRVKDEQKKGDLELKMAA